MLVSRYSRALNLELAENPRCRFELVLADGSDGTFWARCPAEERRPFVPRPWRDLVVRDEAEVSVGGRWDASADDLVTARRGLELELGVSRK